MSPDGEGFVRRWSKRKQEARTIEREEANPDVSEPADGRNLIAEHAEGDSIDGLETEASVPNLPDIEDLDAESDYSVFMQVGVPEAVQKLALRKLWQSNPAFASLDGLNDYDEDFKSLLEAGVEFMEKARAAGQKFIGEPKEDETEAVESAENGDGETSETEEEPATDGQRVNLSENDDDDLGAGES